MRCYINLIKLIFIDLNMNSEKENIYPPYLDPSISVEERVNNLLSQMTIEEKVAQLGSVYPSALMKSGELSPERMKRKLNHGIGQISRISGTLNLTPVQCARMANKIQKFLKENTRLGIPAIIHEECLSGYCGRGGTIFPQMIGVASTWDPDLVEDMTEKIRLQMLAVGARQGLSPVLDIARDPRWGRTEETFGEDPYLTSMMGVSYVKGLQSDFLKTGVIATGKHFVGYSHSQGGRNWAPAFITKRELLEVFTKPFETTIVKGNIGSIMNAYHEIDGIPCGVSYELLTELLRNKFEFNGIVVSDYLTIEIACLLHRIASKPIEAAILAIKAGLDVELPRSSGYGRRFVRTVKKGVISEDLIDRSVRRILTMKFKLELFENPYVDENPDHIEKIFSDLGNRELAKKIALESIILLKNENNILPLKKNLNSIAVIGPNADSVRNLLGDYTFVSQFENSIMDTTGVKDINEETEHLYKIIIENKDKDKFTKENYKIQSIFEAIKKKMSSDTNISYAKGCEILGDDKSGFAEAVNIAKKSELVILVVGGKSGLILDCTSGEARDRSRLTLPGVQEELIHEIYGTDTPIILILVNGRPLSISWENDHIPAILETWLPGEMGAEAIADVIFGDYNPGGKLPISIPRNAGQIPIYHNSKPTGNLSVWTWNYVEENTTPLFPFGFGLSYTKFEYSNLVIDKKEIDVHDKVNISFDLKNIGKLSGEEVVQLYLHDRESIITRPIEELFGFKRISLRPEQKVRVTFTISIKQLGFYNLNMDFVVEPGNVDVYIGSIHSIHGSNKLDLANDIFSHKDVKLKGEFKIIGETLILNKEKEFFSEVKVEKINNS
jgi:beta-glucosidase